MKKITRALLCILTVLLITPISNIKAEENHSFDNFSELSDSSFLTAIEFKKGDSITFTNDIPFKGLYILFDKMPSSVELIANGTHVNKKIEYMHEYIEGSYAREMTIILESDCQINEIYLINEENMDVIQEWKPSAVSDLLVVSTHADDEWLWLGGTIPYYVDRGKSVQVAYAINHNIKTDRGECYYRTHQLLDALYHSGVRQYPIISEFPDYYANTFEKADEIFGQDNFINYFTDVIRQVRPRVIVTQDLWGEYGHGVHILTSFAVTKAIHLAQDPNYDDGLKTHRIEKLYLHLYPENQMRMDWNVPLYSNSQKTVIEIAEESYEMNVSEVESFTMGYDYDYSLFGLVYTNVGEDVNKNDFFENIPNHRPLFISKKTIAIYGSAAIVSIGIIYLTVRSKHRHS